MPCNWSGDDCSRQRTSVVYFHNCLIWVQLSIKSVFFYCNWACLCTNCPDIWPIGSFDAILIQPLILFNTMIARHGWNPSNELYKLGQSVDSSGSKQMQWLQYFVHLCVLHLPWKSCVRRMIRWWLVAGAWAGADWSRWAGADWSRNVFWKLTAFIIMFFKKS